MQKVPTSMLLQQRLLSNNGVVEIMQHPFGSSSYYIYYYYFIKDFSTKTRELRSQARSDALERAAPRLKNAT
jgi:hypothetical protein